MKLSGMALALREQMGNPSFTDLSFEERLGLLVDREMTERESKRLKTRLKSAKLRQSACLEDVDLNPSRGLDRSLLRQLADCQWIRQTYNVFITGPTGVGKTYLACALAQQACRMGYSAYYARTPKLFQELALGKGDGRYTRLLTALAKKDLLVLDDWGLAPLTDEQRRDLLEIVEDRHGRRSTVIASQVSVEQWYQSIGDPTLADAILDRIVHQAYQFNLKGDSMRKKRSITTENERSE